DDILTQHAHEDDDNLEVFFIQQQSQHHLPHPYIPSQHFETYTTLPYEQNSDFGDAFDHESVEHPLGSLFKGMQFQNKEE
ncbi:unnamed protein product, partial [Sphenostylis stenocarpa]